jgi:hypothetical protein
MDEDMACRSALRGKGGINIAVCNMPVARCTEIEGPYLALRAADRGGAGISINPQHLRARAVHAPRIAIVARQPDGVSGTQLQPLACKYLHFARTPLAQPPVDGLAALRLQRDRGPC